MKTRGSVTAPALYIVLSRAHRFVSLLAEHSIAGTGLCATDFAVLEALLHKGPLSIGEIQAKVLLASGSMTAAVDRVEKLGLVVRKTTPEDRRARILELTLEGRRVTEVSFKDHARDLEAAMSVLNKEEKLQLYETLKKLGRFAEQKEKTR